jgi:hypothetical protein
MPKRRNGFLLLATLAASASLVVAEVDATLNAAAANAGTFSTTAIYSPTAPAAAPLGHTASVSWTASAPSTGNGYVVSGVNVGSNPATSCPATAASYSFVGATASTSFTDSTPLAGGTDGTYVCYLVRRGFDTTAPGSWAADPLWVSANSLPIANTAIGFFATSVTLPNGGVGGRIDGGDTIVISFDQAVNTAGLTVSQVCIAVGSKTVYLGAGTGVITCPTTATIGTLTGINVSSTLSLDGAFAATAAWTNSNRTLTITVGAQNMGSTISAGAGTTTFVAAALISSSGAATICTTAICRPTTSTVP